MSSVRFQRRDGLVRRQVGPDLLVFDPATDELHVLNPTCAVLWDELDEPRTTAELTSALERSFDIDPAADVAADVARIIEDLEGRGLVGGISG